MRAYALLLAKPGRSRLQASAIFKLQGRSGDDDGDEEGSGDGIIPVGFIPYRDISGFPHLFFLSFHSLGRLSSHLPKCVSYNLLE
jgi:hypothetical protein